MIKRLLIELAIRNRWKSQLWDNMFMKQYKKTIDEAVSRIDLDVKDIKIVKK